MMQYPWHKTYWQKFIARIESGHIPHGLMITGPNGIGKTQFAKRIAHWLLCQNRSEQPCGNCSGCKWFNAQTHPDFFEITMAEDKSSIGIAQIRELVEKLSQTSMAGGLQVVLLHPADAMTIAAANSLLKTLEEPLGAVVLLLVTSQPSNLPATIISRCQMIRMAAPSEEEARLFLLTQLADQQASQAGLLLALADGLPLLALQLADFDFSVVDHLFGDMDPVMLASQWHKENPERLLCLLLTLVMDMVRAKVGVGEGQLRHQHSIHQLLHRAALWKLEPLFGYLGSLMRDLALLRTQQTNPNIQLLLEKNLIQWQNCSHSKYF